MGADLFHELSTAELRKEVAQLVALDQRSLPDRAKVFAAVAKLQKYDLLAEVVPVEGLETSLGRGFVEINRGIAATRAVPARVYFRDLLFGAMHPGTQIAYGHGIYFATPSVPNAQKDFPRVSHVARKHAASTVGEAGIIVRGALRPDAKTLELDDLHELFRENRNRANSAGITDVGTLAAALGFDAYFRDGAYADTDERIWTVVNRGALIFQDRALQIPPQL